MRQSRELDNILNECLEQLLQGETLEQCLGRFPEHADELKPLLQTALVVRQAVAIQPRLEFREIARHRFRLALQGMARKPRRSFFSWRWQPQWATVVTIVLILLLVGGSTVAAANGSMPDEPLYPVKLAVEQTWLTFTPSAMGKAELYGRLTERRMTEITRMADKNKPEKIEQVARRLEVGLAEITLLSSPPGGRGEREMMTPAMAPPVGRASLEGNVPLAEGVPSAVRGFRGGEMGGIKGDRRALLKARMAHYAVNHPARLRALLETAPESARPALLRAIATSENGYEKALRSLDDE